MTKPNYGGLITATFTKLITTKRRQTLQVIHSVGYQSSLQLTVSTYLESTKMGL